MLAPGSGSIDIEFLLKLDQLVWHVPLQQPVVRLDHHAGTATHMFAYLSLFGDIVDKVCLAFGRILFPLGRSDRSLSVAECFESVICSDLARHAGLTSKGDLSASGFSQVDSFVMVFAQ